MTLFASRPPSSQGSVSHATVGSPDLGEIGSENRVLLEPLDLGLFQMWREAWHFGAPGSDSYTPIR